MNKITNVVIAGLGGQGVLKASDIVADVAFGAGLDVKKSEVHGMSQRGGSVSSDVRFGEHVFSPMVPEGEADFLVVLAPDQIEVNSAMLGSDGVLIEPSQVDASKLRNKKSTNVALSACSVDTSSLPTRIGLWQSSAIYPKRFMKRMLKRSMLARAVL
jgi:indolepyruvate ferredoxin oxidoreductase beta subunit